MFRIVLILLLSFSLLFSCSKKNAKKKPSVILDGKVQEGGCKRFDFYCKRTGRVLDSSDIDVSPEPTEQEIRLWLAGNLCRCTGYDKIIRAVMDAAEEMRG